MNQNGEQAHREGRRGVAFFDSCSMAAAPHAGRYKLKEAL